jgi:hypothetical protein
VPDRQLSSKYRGSSRAGEAWATSTVVLYDADHEDLGRGHDVIFGLRNALLVSGLLWAVIVIAGFAIFA